MSKRFALFLSFFVVMCGLTALNFQRIIESSDPVPAREELFELNQIKSLTLISDDNSYRLNPLDQIEVLSILSSSLKLKTQSLKTEKVERFAFDKIIIENKDGEEFSLTPQFVMDENIVFAIPNEENFNYMIERSHGKLFNLLKNISL